MKLLAIDCTTPTAYLGISIDQKLKIATIEAGHRLTDSILAVLSQLMSENAVSFSDVDYLVYTSGPGNFTGARVGIAVTQALSLAHGIPSVGISSLQLLAQGCYRRQQAVDVLAAIDARMGEVYWGCFHLDESGVMQAQGAERVSKPDAIVITNKRKWYGVGNAVENYQDLLSEDVQKLKWDSIYRPEVVDMITIAQSKILAENIDRGIALPKYIRDDVAQKKTNDKSR